MNSGQILFNFNLKVFSILKYLFNYITYFCFVSGINKINPKLILNLSHHFVFVHHKNKDKYEKLCHFPSRTKLPAIYTTILKSLYEKNIFYIILNKIFIYFGDFLIY